MLLLRNHVRSFVTLYKKTQEIRQQGERLREMDKTDHEKLLNEATARLEAEAKRNRFFTLPIVMLAIAGFDGHFVQINPLWKKTLGFSDKELMSKPFLHFVQGEDQKNAIEQLARLQASMGTGYFENRFCCKDGSSRWLRMDGRCFRRGKTFTYLPGTFQRGNRRSSRSKTCARNLTITSSNSPRSTNSSNHSTIPFRTTWAPLCAASEA